MSLSFYIDKKYIIVIIKIIPKNNSLFLKKNFLECQYEIVISVN